LRIQDPGDTEFLEGEHVDKVVFRGGEHPDYHPQGSKPASAEPLLLGITKASLTTQSFISAASFRRRLRVLNRRGQSAGPATTCSASRRTSSSAT